MERIRRFMGRRRSEGSASSMDQQPSSPPAAGPGGSEQVQQRKRSSSPSTAPEVEHDTKRQRLLPESSTRTAEESTDTPCAETDARLQRHARAAEYSNAPAIEAADGLDGDGVRSTTISGFEDDMASKLLAYSHQDELLMSHGGKVDTHETTLPLSAIQTAAIGQGKYEATADLVISLYHTDVTKFPAGDDQPDSFMTEDNSSSRHIAEGAKIEPDKIIDSTTDKAMPDATITQADVNMLDAYMTASLGEQEATNEKRETTEDDPKQTEAKDTSAKDGPKSTEPVPCSGIRTWETADITGQVPSMLDQADVYGYNDPMATFDHCVKTRTSNSPYTFPETGASAMPQLSVKDESVLQNQLVREQEETEAGQRKEQIRKDLDSKTAVPGRKSAKSDLPFPIDKRSEGAAGHPKQQEITHSVAPSLNQGPTEADHDDSHGKEDPSSTEDLAASRQKGAGEAAADPARPGGDKMAQDNSRSVAADIKKKDKSTQPSRRRSIRGVNQKLEVETDDESPGKSSGQKFTGRRTRGAIPKAPVVESDQEDNDDGGDFGQYSRSSSGRRTSKRHKTNTKVTTLQEPAKATADIRLLLSQHQASEKDLKSPDVVANSNVTSTSNMENPADVLTIEPEAPETIECAIFATNPDAIDEDNEHEAVIDIDLLDEQQKPAEKHVSPEDYQAANLDDIHDVVMTGLANPDNMHDPPSAIPEKDITAQIDELKRILQSLKQDDGQLHPHAMAEIHRHTFDRSYHQLAHTGSEDLPELFGSTDFPYSIRGSEDVDQDDSDHWNFNDDRHLSSNQGMALNNFILDTGTFDLDISNEPSSSLPTLRATPINNNIDLALSANGVSVATPISETSLQDFYKQDRELIKLAKPFVTDPFVHTVKVRMRDLESLQNKSFEKNASDNETGKRQEVIVLDETDDEYSNIQDHTRSNPAVMIKGRRRDRNGVSARALASSGLDTTGASFSLSTRSTASASSRRTGGDKSFTNVGGGTPSNKQQPNSRQNTTPTTAAGQARSQHGPDLLRYLQFPQDVTSDVNLDQYLRDLGAEHLDKSGLKIDCLLKKSWGCPWPQDEQQSFHDFVARGGGSTDDPAKGYSLMDGFPLVEGVAFVVPHNRASPDGDCYWRALSTSLYGDNKYYDLVKAEHLGYMYHVLDTPAHPRHDLYKNSLNSKLFVTSGPVADVFKANLYQLLHMPHAWTPAAMQQITADLYNVMLVTFSLDMDNEKVTEVSIRGAYNSRHIFMLFSEGCHYNPMFPNDFMPWEFRYPRPTVENTAGFKFAPKRQAKREAWQHPWRVEFTKEVLPPVPRLHGCPVQKLRHYMKAK
ncbi:hypothetical protein MN608_05162 [Microdochium nivale]|nr:hypothetical protein MN608_05162 [Microdochium nivale]